MITEREMKLILDKTPSESYREVAAALTGAKNQMSISETAKFYSVPSAFVKEVWEKHGLLSKNSASTEGKRSRKSAIIESYIKENIGKTITPQDLVSATGISMPTFYNYYNANRGFFKKIKRGQFEIVDPNKERQSSKKWYSLIYSQQNFQNLGKKQLHLLLKSYSDSFLKMKNYLQILQEMLLCVTRFLEMILLRI